MQKLSKNFARTKQALIDLIAKIAGSDKKNARRQTKASGRVFGAGLIAKNCADKFRKNGEFFGRYAHNKAAAVFHVEL